MRLSGRLLLSASVGMISMALPSNLAWAADTRAVEVELAQADTASTDVGEEEIVVTAEKRSQSVQKVPAAISAFGAEKIQTSRLETMQDMQRATPGLQFSDTAGNAQLNLRGLGVEFGNASGEGSVITNVDGVYYARTTGLDAVFSDLARIEVLRGPQGTLYGRNATGGVMNLITREPGEEFAGDASITLGSRDRIQVTGGVEGPIDDSNRARFSVFFEDRGGDQRNIIDGGEVNTLNAFGVRGTWISELSDDLEVTVRGDYYDDDVERPYNDMLAEFPTGNPFGIVPSNPGGIFQSDLHLTPTVPLPNNGRDIAQDFNDGFYKHGVWGGSITAEWSPSESWTLKSITAFRRNEFGRRYDVDGSSASILSELVHHTNSSQFTQEFNVTGETQGGIEWIAGLYYFDEDVDYDYFYHVDALAAAAERATEIALGLPQGALAGTFDNSLQFFGEQKGQSASAFGQVTVPITDQLSLIGGLRYNWDKKDSVQTLKALGGTLCDELPVSEDWSEVTWRAGAEYEITDDNLLYANVARGFKAGGVNLGACGNIFDPETIVSYEIGTKNRFFDNLLTLNVDAFYYDYTNLQQTIYTTAAITENAANATVYGAEIEARVIPFEGFEVTGGLSLLHAEFDEFLAVDPLHPELGFQNFVGRRLPHSAEVSANASFTYRTEIGIGEAALQYEIFYSDGWYGDSANTPEARQPAYSLHNIRLTYELEDVEFGVFAENIGDEKYYTSLTANGTAGGVYGTYGFRKRLGVFTRLRF